MSEDDGGFIDAETSFSSDNDKLNFQFIILSHLKKITQLCCVEWHGGYWQTKYRNMGGGSGATEKYYVQDSRKCFWNSVNCLYDLCYPYFDEKMLNEDTEIKDKIKKNYESYEQAIDEIEDRNRDYIKEEYLDSKMDLIRELFRSLSSFLKRVDYFKAQIIED